MRIILPTTTPTMAPLERFLDVEIAGEAEAEAIVLLAGEGVSSNVLDGDEVSVAMLSNLRTST